MRTSDALNSMMKKTIGRPASLRKLLRPKNNKGLSHKRQVSRPGRPTAGRQVREYRERWKSHQQGRVARASAKASKYVSAEYEGVLATVFGNTAIATGVFKAPGAPMRRESLWIFMSVGLIRG